MNAKAGIKEKARGSSGSGGHQDGGQDKKARRADSEPAASVVTVEPPRNKNVIPNDGTFLATFGKIA